MRRPAETATARRCDCTFCVALQRAAIRERDLALIEAAERLSATHLTADTERQAFARCKGSGVTLVELLAVLGIVAVLAASALWCGAETVAHVREVLAPLD